MGFDGTTGQAAAGFPKWTGGWSLFAPATGDVKGTGQTDVSEMTREGYLSIWSTAGNGCAGNSEAWHWHQDDRNTGHYGTDTRPPSAISDLNVTQSGSNDTLTFTAVGDDWKCGTAAGYQLFTSSSPITQDTIGQATPITVSQAPGAAGAKESLTIPASANKGFLAIRAVDHAGNIGPVRVVAAAPVTVAEFGAGPVAALGLTGFAGIGAALSRRRRRFSAGRARRTRSGR
jgi:hypothetical protein